MNIKQAAAILGKKGGQAGTGACKRQPPEYYRRIAQKWRDENLKPLPQRFWEKVDKQGPNGCWIFTAYKNDLGYGFINVKGTRTRAHRLAWELTKGPIPFGLFVLHDCPGGDNPSCVNPDHLYLGTHADNMRDASKKKQFPDRRGEKSVTAILTDAQAKQIRQEFQSGEGVTQAMLAKKYGVSFNVIHNVVRRRSFVHI